LYNDPEYLRFAIMRCNGFEALLKRKHLIEKAREDYFAGRYYSCIYLLLSIADGFVNEFEREHRGLHTRTSEELSAWDSPISHHKGIGSVHRIFVPGPRYLATKSAFRPKSCPPFCLSCSSDMFIHDT
jgi:hypothetical protein